MFILQISGVDLGSLSLVQKQRRKFSFPLLIAIHCPSPI